MSKKYMVLSPTFSEFRAGEPEAFDIAERALAAEGKNHFKKYVNNVWVIAKGNTISVYLNGDNRPFDFIVEEI